ncbi:MAG: hypothetical protein IPH91_06695 [Elusimicrobia bacterium]|nr:hypothetical protein [Elusimicrobiota bacterium]MBK8650849.1 hypothetical protein [Elusimicrobiota bacterium]
MDVVKHHLGNNGGVAARMSDAFVNDLSCVDLIFQHIPNGGIAEGIPFAGQNPFGFQHVENGPDGAGLYISFEDRPDILIPGRIKNQPAVLRLVAKGRMAAMV